jgi:large subunit ribosomal protein L40
MSVRKALTRRGEFSKVAVERGTPRRYVNMFARRDVARTGTAQIRASMVSSRLALSRPIFPFRISVRHSSTRHESAADPAKEIIRKALYPPNIDNKPSPTGAWRLDVARAIQIAVPSKQAHETIERAWLLYQRHQRWRREEEMGRKYECVKKAMDELEKIDPKRFSEANRLEDSRQRGTAEVKLAKTLRGAEKKLLESRLPGLFPRELRVPTDTPPRDGWKYDYTPGIRRF